MMGITPKFRPVGTRPVYEVVPFYTSEHFDHKRSSSSRRKDDDGLPENLTWFDAQIAGHKTQVKDGQQQLGFIKDLDFDERILKPVMNDKRGKIEKSFYTSIFASSSPTLAPYRELLPQFHGVREIWYKGQRHELLDMEDISECFVLPAVIDIKVGQRTFGPDANEEKRRKETEKYPQQEEIGFRILGYKIESGETKVASRDREYCLTLETEEIEGALREFLSFRGPDVHVIIDELLKQLKTVTIAASLGVYHIFSSSLLIAYEADREAAPRAEIRWIDFSHVFPGNGQPDENYLYGVRRLEEFLRSIRMDLC